jgi:hypothetical protein
VSDEGRSVQHAIGAPIIPTRGGPTTPREWRRLDRQLDRRRYSIGVFIDRRDRDRAIAARCDESS